MRAVPGAASQLLPFVVDFNACETLLPMISVEVTVFVVAVDDLLNKLITNLRDDRSYSRPRAI